MSAQTLANPIVYTGRPVTETMINGFFSVDKHWTVTCWNRAAEMLLGVLAAHIVGKNLWEEFVGTIPLNFYQFYNKAFVAAAPYKFTEYWAEKGAWYEVIAYPDTQGLSVSFKSMHHYHNPDNPLRQAEKLITLYRFVAEVSNDCLWEWNIENNELTWIDSGHHKVFGYPIENAIVPRSFWESCVHPDDRTRLLSKFSKIIQEAVETIREDDYRFKRANGSYAYVHDRSYIVYEGNVPVRMIGATRDITDRKLEELKILENERRLSLIARETFNSIIITDEKGRITWVNSAFTNITEYELEEAVGKKPGELLQGEETSPLTVEYISRQIKAKLPFDCEIINYSKSGRKYWTHIQGQALLDEHGRCERFFSIQADVTDKILHAQTLLQEAASRQIEITNAVISAQENERADIGKELHDNVNQILGATKLYIEMAKNAHDNKTAYLDKSSDYSVMVIEEIRKISKTLIPLAMGSMNMVDSIQILINDINTVHLINIDFHNELQELTGISDKMQLNIFRIVQEQINNILKHAAAKQVNIYLRRKENTIILMITDDGQGCVINEGIHGVGLRNILSRAELYFGKLEIYSSPGEGYILKVEMQIG